MKHDDFEDGQEAREPVPVLHAASDVFETRMYGTIDVSYLVFPGPEKAGSGAIIVTRRVPYGMAMTQWRREVLGTFPVVYPYTEH